jgi:hypothetical protein
MAISTALTERHAFAVMRDRSPQTTARAATFASASSLQMVGAVKIARTASNRYKISAHLRALHVKT